MTLAIFFGTLALLLVALGQVGWQPRRAIATATFLVLNGVGLAAIILVLDGRFGANSLAAHLARMLTLVELAALGAYQCGVSATQIVGYGLPAIAFGVTSLAVEHGGEMLALRVGIVLFVLSMAIHFALLTKPADPVSFGQILWLAIWFGTMTSFVSLGWRVLRLKLVGPMKLINSSDPLAYAPAESFYLLPALLIVAFLLVGLMFCVLRLIWPNLATYSVVAFSFSFLAMIELTDLLLGWLAPPFSTLYLLAMTFGLEQWVRRNPRLLSRTQLAFCVPLLITAVLGYVGPKLDPRDDSTNRIERGNRQNVLLIVMDTARRESIGAYDYHRPTTPNLDRWALEGTQFTNAVTNSSWTLPAHASMFTGRWCHEHAATFLTPLDGTYPTLAEALRDEGYATVAFVANRGNCGLHTGLGRGFQIYQDSPSAWRLTRASSTLLQIIFGTARTLSRTAEEISDEFLGWIDQRDNDRPFFAFLNYLDPHFPYRIPDETFDQFSTLPPELRAQVRRQWIDGDPNAFSPRDPLELQLALDTYDGAVKYMDWHISRVLDRLKAVGLLENTLVVVTNDHGEHFGENNLFLHGTSLYRPLIDAPLVVLFPKQTGAPPRVDAVVGQQELPATVLSVLGLPNLKHFPGRSWTSCWNELGPDGRPRDRIVLSQLGQAVELAGQLNTQGVVYSLVANGLHYIAYFGGTEEIFDWTADPAETMNLATTPRGEELLRPMREYLRRILSQPNER